MSEAPILVREVSPLKAVTAIMALKHTPLGLTKLLTLVALAIKEALGKLWVVF